MSLDIRLHHSLHDIAQAEWDACARAGSGQAGAGQAGAGRASDPFTTHRFLLALEDSGSVGAGTGWAPHYLSVQDGARMIAAAPMYLKSHSQGEYVFDHAWADAWARAGGQYYPKLQVAVPFTPVPGRRFLTLPGHSETGQAALVQGMVQVAADNQLSSAHVTFCTGEEAQAGKAMGLLSRIGEQFHWLNQGYGDFDDFLGALSSRKRKNIRRERRLAQAFGGEIVALSGDEISPEHMDAFWQFYQDTGARKWGKPYLTRRFFDIARERLAEDMLLVLARREGRWVAGALNFIGADALFGRWWGAVEQHSCLHFELCYYQAIDYAIAHRLARVEAGAQGEHKIARGYLPVTTHSLHWIADAGFRDAVAEFVAAEARAVGEDIEILTQMGPFRAGNQREQD